MVNLMLAFHTLLLHKSHLAFFLLSVQPQKGADSATWMQ